MIEDNRYYWSHLKMNSVTVRVKPKKKTTGVIFRVGNVLDKGNGRQMMMLEQVDYPENYNLRRRSGDVAIPFRMGNIDFIYTSLRKPQIRNVNTLLSALYKKGGVGKIVPEVLCPGDLLVFKQERDSLKIEMVEALRVIDNYTGKQKLACYAL